MARHAPTLSPEPSFDFKEIKQRFFDLNKARLRRTLADLRLRQKEFVELLPLLYHINHPMLPGYISKQGPAGIPDYQPTNQTLNLTKKLTKSFEYKKRAYRKYMIQAIYMMGSTGTIAYSNKSDIDVWVCYDSSLKKEQIKMLQAKSEAIEEWAQTLDVDAHIFLVNPEEFREGKHNALNTESSGSALHYLLLEEFYRTSLLLAGKYPTWWLVPPEHEHNYNDFVDDIKTKRYIHGRDSIDFGGLNEIPAEEFYGATLWLLYKGINSPYKSVLKTSLMESYASEYPNIDILGLRFKQAVYNGENELNKLDPYLMMLHKVEEYLTKDQQLERLDLIRRSFYYKVNEKLSEESNKENNWRRELIAELVSAWRWSTSQLFLLDSKEDWKIQRVIEERNALMHEHTNSYRFLSGFARSNTASNLIKPTDLNLLGRKLYAAFERKAGKVDIIYRGIVPHLNQSHISIHCIKSEDGNFVWLVFNGTVSEEEVSLYPPVKRAYSLIELLAWCYFNRIIMAHTKTAIYANNSQLTEKELQSITNAMNHAFAHESLEEDNLNELKRPAFLKQVLTVVNTGLDPFVQHTRRGDHLTSNRTDSLRFGGRLENLTNSIDQVLVTSWHEVLTFSYKGVSGLFQCLHDYMQWMPPSQGVRPPAINAVSYSSYRGDSIAHRMENLFQDVMDCFYSKSTPRGTRYILAIEWDYYVLHMDEDYLHYHKAGDLENLKNYLSMPSRQFQNIVFDVESLNDDILPVLYKHNQAGLVQVYFHINDKVVQTYILDENGSLFSHKAPFYDAASLVNQYEIFFESVAKRVQYQKDGQGNYTAPAYQFNYLHRNSRLEWEIIRHRNNKLFKSSYYLPIQVIASKTGDELSFKAYCENQEFSTLEYGDQLYQELASFVLTKRQEGNAYPIYITDLDLSPSIFGSEYADAQTIQYLNYKKYFENKLLNCLPDQDNSR